MATKVNVKTDNWYYSWLLASVVFYKPLRAFVIYFVDIVQNNLGGVISKLTIIPFALILIIPLVKRFRVTADMILLFSFLGLSWIFSLLFHVEFAAIWLEEAVDIFVKAFPFYCVTKNVDDYGELKKILYKAAAFSLIIMALLTVSGLVRGDLFEEGLTYSQFYGVIVSGAAVLCFLAAMEKKSMLYLSLTAAGVGMILLYGARLPLACLVIAGLIYMLDKLFRPKIHWDRMSGKVAFFYGLIFFAVICAVGALIWLTTLELESIGEGQRIIWQIINGKFLQSKGRGAIWEAAIESIIEHPIIGSGIIADRIRIVSNPYVVSYYGEFGYGEFQGFYAHNMILELLMQYGVFLGGVLSALIITIAVSLILEESDKDKRMVAIFAIAETFGILLLSGPVFSWAPFWMMMGMNTKFVVKFPGGSRR